MAPHRIKLSSKRLLTTRYGIRSQKSTIDVNCPFALRSASNSSMALSPTFLIPPKPKRICPFCTVNIRSEWLISGPNTATCFALHTLI